MGIEPGFDSHFCLSQLMLRGLWCSFPPLDPLDRTRHRRTFPPAGRFGRRRARPAKNQEWLRRPQELLTTSEMSSKTTYKLSGMFSFPSPFVHAIPSTRH